MQGTAGTKGLLLEGTPCLLACLWLQELVEIVKIGFRRERITDLLVLFTPNCLGTRKSVELGAAAAAAADEINDIVIDSSRSQTCFLRKRERGCDGTIIRERGTAITKIKATRVRETEPHIPSSVGSSSRR